VGWHIDGLSQSELRNLIGPQLELRLPNGQTGRAVLADISGVVKGNG